MDAVVSTLVTLAVVLELVGLVGIATAGWSLESTVLLWALAFALVLLARGYERFDVPERVEVEVDVGVSR